MAVGATELTTAGSAVSQTSYTTASVTPTANELILAWITNNVPSPVPPTSVTGNGLTWVKIGDGTVGQENTSVWRAMGASPSAGTIVIDFGAVAQNDCEWSIIDYSGTDTSGTNGSGAIVQWNHNEDGVGGTSLTVTLTSAIGAGNAVAAAIGHGTNQTQTAGSGYTKLGEAGGAWGDWAHEWRADGTTTPSMSWASTDSSWGIAVEILVAGAAPVVDYDPLWRYRIRPPGIQAPNYAPFPGPLGDATVPGPPAIWTPNRESQYGTFF